MGRNVAEVKNEPPAGGGGGCVRAWPDALKCFRPPASRICRSNNVLFDHPNLLASADLLLSSSYYFILREQRRLPARLLEPYSDTESHD